MDVQNPLYTPNSTTRIFTEKNSTLEFEEYRTPYRRDYARLIHSCGFRRLQGKIQLFPGKEFDFFRNRLTHSMEVAQIAKSIAIRLNHRFLDNNENFLNIDTDLIEFSGLAHDLGHPPFGHQGEKALYDLMLSHGGFEGNAQTLRLLTRIEKKFFDWQNDTDWIKDKIDNRIGLNLTARSLSSILKYDKKIKNHNGRAKLAINDITKGYYESESEIVKKMKQHVLNKNTANLEFKTIECQIMDIADDIAYSVYDLEDCLKAGFFNPYDMLFPIKSVIEEVTKRVSKKLDQNYLTKDIRELLVNIVFAHVFPDFDFSAFRKNSDSEIENFLKAYFLYMSDSSYRVAKKIGKDGYLRTEFSSRLVGMFIRNVVLTKYDTINPCLSKIEVNHKSKLIVEVLKQFNFVSQIASPKIKISEYRAKRIITYIFNVLMSKSGYNLLPEDYRYVFDSVDKFNKRRIICDFIAGMTDAYATEFYGRLISENPATIFKPF